MLLQSFRLAEQGVPGPGAAITRGKWFPEQQNRRHTT